MNNKTLKVFVDGSARANGKCGIGIVGIYNHQVIFEHKEIIQEAKTNNEAEYWAVIICLFLIDHYMKEDLKEGIIIYSDSQLVVNQINGKYQINKKELERLKTIFDNYKEKYCYSLNIQLKYIPREKNKIANKLAQEITK